MAKRSNHYDVAFEQFLRLLRRPYVSVNETRRALCRDDSLKSMDFIVYSGRTQNLLVDVKGRRFPSGNGSHRWENWATQDDIDCLLKWQEVFGSGFRALLVFAYHVVATDHDAGLEPCHTIRDRTYAFFGVWADQYGDAMRQRSPRWDTVWLPAQPFARLRAPISEFL
ncbi:MAG: HYExAFE family protein [Planctomycetaceae bacterium]|nr:HYExAFE family protein [Planctomycetaceae bacterium]